MQDEATAFRLESERRFLEKSRARRIYLKRKAAQSLSFLYADLCDVCIDIRDLTLAAYEWVKIWTNT